MSADQGTFEDFDYVVEIKEGEKICFGSTIIRNTCPIGKGLSPLQKRLAPENFHNTGPGCYHTEKYTSAFSQEFNKIRSKAGVGPLASNDPRFKERIHFRTPSPGRYETTTKWGTTKKSLAPFGISSKVRETKFNNNPGPLTYDIRETRKCRRTRFMYNFGRPKMILSVETKCVPKPQDKCLKCHKMCEGDYWHKNHNKYLCQLCWKEEKIAKEIFNENELKMFKKIRICSFMHQHESVDAALTILSQSRINKKIRLENYLDLYIKC